MKNQILFAGLILSALISLSFKSSEPAPVRTIIASKALVFPVAGKSKLVDLWGARRDGGRRKHKGIDIHARKGTPVVAVADGVISTRGTFPVGGKVLWLNAEDHSWEAYYAHLDQWYVREGQYVKKGQVIGTVGNTGNARYTPPHLHFGISKGDDWVNPLPYVKNAPKIVAKAPKKKATVRKKGTVKKGTARKSSTVKKKTPVKKSSTVKRPVSRKSQVRK